MRPYRWVGSDELGNRQSDNEDSWVAIEVVDKKAKQRATIHCQSSRKSRSSSTSFALHRSMRWLHRSHRSSRSEPIIANRAQSQAAILPSRLGLDESQQLAHEKCQIEIATQHSHYHRGLAAAKDSAPSYSGRVSEQKLSVIPVKRAFFQARPRASSHLLEQRQDVSREML